MRAQVEALERRALLTVVTWTNAAGGDFNDAANWNSNTVPVDGDDVVITLAGTYTVSLAGANLALNSLTLGNASSGAQSFTVDGSTLSVAAASAVSARGVLSFGNTTIGGAGTLSAAGQVIARGTDAINAPFSSSAGSVLRVLGNSTDGNAALTVANGYTSGGQIQLTSLGGVFDSTLNVTSGTLSIPGGVFVSTMAGSGGTRNLNAQIANAGTIAIAAPTTINKPDAAHFNAGSIALSAGDLTVAQSGTTPSFTSSGTITVQAGRTLTVTGAPLTLSGGGTLNGNGTVAATVNNVSSNTGPSKPGAGLQLYYESFNYNAGSQLQGQGGWLEPGYNDNLGSDFQTPEIITSSSLSFGTLQTSGRAVQTSGKYSYDNINFGPGGFIGGTSGTFWFGFLIRQDSVGIGGQAGPDYGGVVLGNAPDINTVLIGKPGGGAGVNNWGLDNNSSANQASSSVPATLGTTAFLVAKVVFAPGPDAITLYVNPTPGSAEGSLVAAATLNVELFAFNQIALSTGASAHWTMDEIRIGTSFGDVAPRTTGQMTINGDYTQSAGATFTGDIFGSTVDSLYDQLVVNGAVSLAGTLTLNAGATSGFQTYTLISNDGVDPVAGTFNGLAEGTLFQSGGKNFRISYIGGDGNDVAVTYFPTITVNDISVTEGTGGTSTATFTVTLSDAGSATSTVQWETAGGTATTPDDYTAASGTVTFDPFVTSRQVNIALNPDALDEVNETFNLLLSNPTNAIISDATGVATINDDDPPPTISINDVTVPEGDSGSPTAGFTISLSTVSSKTITVVASTANGTATSPSDYAAVTSQLVIFLPGETSKPLNVTVNGDTLDENNETFVVNLASPTNAAPGDGQGQATITDDDPLPTVSINDVTLTEGNSGTSNASFTVSLSVASGRTVTVLASTASGTATSPSDYTAISNQAITFLAGETSKTLNVTVKGDTANEDDETFVVNLSGPTNVTIDDGQGQATISNDDPQPTLSINDISAPEGNSGTSNASFTVSLSAASGKTVTVLASTADGSATDPGDYAAVSNQMITFLPGETSKPFNVAVNGDTYNESNKTFFVNLSTPSNATIADAQGQGTISNDDPPLTAAWATVSPDPRGTALSSLNITFTEPVSGFDAGDLSLTRDGAAVSLAGATLGSTDNITWTLGNLSDLTANAGSYTLTLTASGSDITGGAGAALSANGVRSWKMNTINGTAGGDTIKLVRNGANTTYDVFVNNATATPDYSVNVATLGTLFIVGNGGTDTLAITGAAGGADTFNFSNTQITRVGGSSTLVYSGINTLSLANATFDSTADLNGLALASGTGALVRLNSTQHLGGLDVGAGSTVRVTSGGNKVLVTTALTTAGILDLTDEDLVLNYSAVSPLGTWNGTAYDGVTGMITSGRNGGDWSGSSGIITSAGGSTTTLGVAESFNAIGAGGGMFGAVSVDDSAILVKFTYGGDANLDGKVTISDYGKIDFNVGIPNAYGWFNGDFNYDGKLTISDYGIIDFIVGIQGGVL